MTRIKEPDPKAKEVPDYKSPPLRIIKSLRKGYDNLRVRIENKSNDMQALRGALRDAIKSREHWKELAKESERKLHETEKALEEIKKKKLRSQTIHNGL